MGEVKPEQKWRHGDVYGIQSEINIETLKANGKLIEGAENNILAYGEVTGHKHEIEAAPTSFQRYECDGKKYLIVLIEGGVNINHAEHGVGVIPKGIWEERIDREFDYLTYSPRQVFD
jgi:hypothetical protein